MERTKIKKLLIGLAKVIKAKIAESTMHGLPMALKHEFIAMKVLWIFVFMGSLSYCAYLMTSLVQSYFTYPLVTNIDTILEIPTKFRKF